MSKFLCLIIILQFQLSLVWGQDNLNFEDIENAETTTDLSELENQNFAPVDNLSKIERRKNRVLVPVFKERKIVKKWLPSAFRSILKKGSTIIRLKDNKTFSTPKKIFVIAKEEAQGSSTSYILNKNDELAYRTSTKNLVSIEPDIILYPQTDPRTTYEEPTRFQTTNKNLKIESDLSFHLQSISSTYLQNFYGGDSGAGSANRLAFRTFYRSQFPFNFGLSFNLQNGSWVGSDGIGNVSWNTFYFGPVLKYDLYQGEEWTFNGQLGVERSFGFDTASESGDTVSFDSLLWRAEVQGLYPTVLGTFSVGVEYTNQRASVVSNNISGLIFDSEKGSLSGFGIVFGYHFKTSLFL